MTKFTTIPGALASLALIHRTSQGSTVAAALANLSQTRREQRKQDEERLARREARLARMDMAKRTLESCPICGDVLFNEKQAAIVLYVLTNGNEGSIARKVCSHHEKGDSFNKVGIIQSITPTKLTPARDGRPYYDSMPLDTPSKPVVDTKPVEAPKVPANLLATLTTLDTTIPQTANTVAESSKFSVATVRKHLASLVKLSLATRGPRLNRSGSFLKVSN